VEVPLHGIPLGRHVDLNAIPEDLSDRGGLEIETDQCIHSLP
jgi:hypothetical protein